MIKVSVLHKLIYTFNVIPIKYIQADSKIHKEIQGDQNGQKIHILKKNKYGRLTFPAFEA